MTTKRIDVKIICLILLGILTGTAIGLDPSLAFAASGRFELRENGRLYKEPAPVPQNDSELIMQFEDRKTLSENWLIQAQPSVHIFEAPTSGSFAGSFTGSFTADIDGRNSFLETRTRHFYLKIGSFVNDWQGTDGINPMDIATVKSYRNPIDSQDMGSWGISIDSRNAADADASWTWEGFYVPWQTPAKLPLSYTGWWPRTTTLPLNQNSLELSLPNEFSYDIESPEILNQANRNNFGGRLQFHELSWDAGLAAVQGQSQVPLFNPIVSGSVVETSPIYIVQMTNPIQIQPVEYMRRTVAALLDYNSNPWIFRLAGRHDQPLGSDDLLPGASGEIVGGFERSIVFDNRLAYFSLQYMRATQSNAPATALNLNNSFQNSLLLGARYSLNDSLLLSYSGLDDLGSHAYYENVKLNDTVGDHWSYSAAVELIGGPANSLLGIWKNQSRGYLAAMYGF